MEKYLLRTGWSVSDCTHPSSGMVLSVAEHENFFGKIKYSKPTFYYLGYDRAGDLRHSLTILAQLEGRSLDEMESVIRSTFDQPLTGFTCRRCGRCCRDVPDAFRGLLSVEEIVAWEQAGHEWILKFIEAPRSKCGGESSTCMEKEHSY